MKGMKDKILLLKTEALQAFYVLHGEDVFPLETKKNPLREGGHSESRTQNSTNKGKPQAKALAVTPRYWTSGERIFGVRAL